MKYVGPKSDPAHLATQGDLGGGGGAPPLVSSLPASPTDGQEIYFRAGPGVLWHLRYDAGASGPYKWEYVGGPDMSAAVITDQAVVSSVFADPATAGPTVTVPLAGEYRIEGAANIWRSGNLTFLAQAAIKFGAAAASDANKVAEMSLPSIGNAARAGGAVGSTIIREAAKGTALKLQYREASAGGSVYFGSRVLHVRPVRVG